MLPLWYFCHFLLAQIESYKGQDVLFWKIFNNFKHREYKSAICEWNPIPEIKRLFLQKSSQRYKRRRFICRTFSQLCRWLNGRTRVLLGYSFRWIGSVGQCSQPNVSHLTRRRFGTNRKFDRLAPWCDFSGRVLRVTRRVTERHN